MASRCLSIVTVIYTVICGVNCEFMGMKGDFVLCSEVVQRLSECVGGLVVD